MNKSWILLSPHTKKNKLVPKRVADLILWTHGVGQHRLALPVCFCRLVWRYKTWGPARPATPRPLRSHTACTPADKKQRVQKHTPKPPGIIQLRKQQALHLGCHDKLVVDDVVRRVAHPKERAGGMEVTRHACPHVHIFTDALGANSRHKQQIKYAAPNLQM